MGKIMILSPSMLESIFKTKQNTSYRTSYCLNVQEVLIALSICSSTNPIIEKIKPDVQFVFSHANSLKDDAIKTPKTPAEKAFITPSL